VTGTVSSTIRKASEIGAVRRKGRRLEEGRVVVYVLPSEGGTRVGFVSSRSVGGAVARNRARRLLREAWRELAPRIRRNHDVVALARPEVRGAKMQDVKSDMERALIAAGIVDPGVAER
jgi:ribonuclease P protein component